MTMCPRCLSEADHSPDEKQCSDNVITRLREAWGAERLARAKVEAECEEYRRRLASLPSSVEAGHEAKEAK